MASLRPPPIRPPSLARRSSFPNSEDVASFRALGSTQFDQCLSFDFVLSLRESIEKALRGMYDNPLSPPDRFPKLVKRPLSDSLSNPLGFGGSLPADGRTAPVVQIVNLHKASTSFSSVATNPAVAAFVAKMCGWEKCGVRLANDQLWGKGPKGAPLAFHRDDPYFMFKQRGGDLSPRVGGGGSSGGSMDEVATLWLALDDLDADVGPLEFCDRSHLWVTAPGLNGTQSNFFAASGGKQATRDEKSAAAAARSSGVVPPPPPAADKTTAHKTTLFAAASANGLSPDDLSFSSTSGLKTGGGSLHSGLLWHGSAENSSGSKVRRGYGVHFFRGDLVWSVPDARRSKLFAKYVEKDVEAAGNPDAEECEICRESFPFVFPPGGHDNIEGESSSRLSASSSASSSSSSASASDAATATHLPTPPLDFSALSVSVTAESRVRNERPCIKVALKNFFSIALSKSLLRAPHPSSSSVDKAALPSLLSAASRDILKLLNSGTPSPFSDGEGEPDAAERDADAAALARLYRSVRATPSAKAADLFGRTLLKAPGVRRALSAMYEDVDDDEIVEKEGQQRKPRVIDLGLEQDKRTKLEFVEAFLESAFFDEPREPGEKRGADVEDGRLVWSKDFDSELKARHAERKERAKVRVDDIERRKNDMTTSSVEYIGGEEDGATVFSAKSSA